MKILTILGSALFCTAGLAALGASAEANIIPVADPYFDQFPAGPTDLNGLMVGPGTPYPYLYLSCGGTCRFTDANVVGWTSSGTYDEAHGIVSGQWQIGDQTDFFNGPPIIAGTSTPEPIVVRDINATISQVVSTTALAGVTYTLDVDLGFNLGPRQDLGDVYLVVGGHQSLAATPLPSDDLTRAQMQGSGNWYDFQTTYTATSADAGAPIEILLSSLTGNATPTAWFADVRLTDSLSSVNPFATPEPATWAMLLLGFSGMAGVAGVRRSLQWRSAVGQLA
jgi:PEP-CTERM motif